uniref:non-specific serine/threonine protein kinase n=1 Tax=Salix viminalis TaxID=40686 RepID=A0A6N2KMN3_SALVM
MSRIILLMHLSSFLVAHLFISGVVSTTFTITNSCNYTVWPGVFSDGASALSTTGFSLEKNESTILKAPAFWYGQFWGRTYCTEDSSGIFSCITGDCGSGKLECSGSVGAPPVTLAEFTLGGFNAPDYYYVSLVDGFNLPLFVVPSGQNCSSTGCIGDVIESCPTELGKSVGCKGACVALGSSIYCCDGGLVHSSSGGKYVYDTHTTYSCPSTDYQIIFCPGKSINTTSYRPNSRNTTGGKANNSRPSTGEITPSSMPEIRPNATSRRKWKPIIAGVVGGVLAIISFVVIVVLRVRWSKSKDTEEDVEDDHIQQVPGMPVRFSYRDLCIATDDFKETLGRGGFGSVFKGVLADRTAIAVKRLDNLSQGKREFLAEVETIGSVHHFNLVRLIGFCAEKSCRLLVYEYMSNGSLDSWIFKKSQTSSLDWKTRKKIIIDIAKGLAYLHEECRQTIIHLDIKPQNILLDPKFNAKISDFGLSKLIDREMSKVQLSMRGTPGYLAPEWHKVLGHVTVKVDVYSFGIVLLEVVCARRNVDHSQPESAFHLLRMLQKSRIHFGYIRSDREEIIRMLEVAAWCLQDDPERRPPMSTVVKVLKGVVSTTFTITNSCNYTVWPGVSPSGLSTTGFSLEKNESTILKAPASWSGRFWGRTHCTEDSSGNFSCITGDCGSGKLECSGSGGAPPVTLAEFTLGGFNAPDYYYVSLVDGFNLPLFVVPSGQNCSSTGCIGDVIESCPTDLGTEVKRAGCKGACVALGSSIYCCNGTSSSGGKYSYAYDTLNTYSCPSTDYQIIFCAGKSINTTSYMPNSRNTTGGTANNSRPSTGEITPSSMPEIRPNATSRRKWEPIIAGVDNITYAFIFILGCSSVHLSHCCFEGQVEQVEDERKMIIYSRFQECL